MNAGDYLVDVLVNGQFAGSDAFEVIGTSAPIQRTATTLKSLPLDRYTDPFAYCKAIVNNDGSLEGGMNDSDGRYVGPEPPSEVAKALGDGAGPYTWRCMNGRVLACFVGASGRGCRKAGVFPAGTTSVTQMSAIRKFCARNPNSEYVPNNVNYSASDWKCAGDTPVVVKSYPVDERGFIQGNWVTVLPLNSDTRKSISINSGSRSDRP